MLKRMGSGRQKSFDLTLGGRVTIAGGFPIAIQYRDSVGGCTWRCRWRCLMIMFASCMVNHVRSVIAILQCHMAHSTRSSFPIHNIAPPSDQTANYKRLAAAVASTKSKPGWSRHLLDYKNRLFIKMAHYR